MMNVYRRNIVLSLQVLSVLLVTGLTGCASTEELYAEYEHQCRVSVISNATGTVIVENTTGNSMLWEPAVYFNYDKANLLAEEYARLDANINVLAQYPELKLHVRGFTDSIASRGYNVELATRRVQTVTDYLVKNNVSLSRIIHAPLGEEVPLADNETYENRALNRRVELVLLDQDGRPAPIRMSTDKDSWQNPDNVSEPGLEKDWRR